MDDRPLCLLALDGGGIRGLSELIVLEQIMSRIQYDLRLDQDLLPADFFDLIGGTSTGGLIALLLGRLRLSVPQARREYIRIAEEVFSLKQYYKKDTFDGWKLKEAVRRLLSLRGSRTEERMLERGSNCKVYARFVCAVPQQDVRARAGPRLFRTYRVRENASFNCTIWEACRATSAAPSYFEPISIGEEGEQETFIDGGLGYNNPVELVLEEARRVFPNRKVACVVSIGTGVARTITFPGSPKTSPIKLINALQAMATESDTKAETVQRRFRDTKDVYFRFSVDRGLEDIGLEEWKKLSSVRTFTSGYLGQHVVSEQINTVVQALLASKTLERRGTGRLVKVSGGLSGETSDSQGAPQTVEWQPSGGSIPNFTYTTDQLAFGVTSTSQRHFIVPFGRNADFVGRERILQKLLHMIPPSRAQDNCQRTAIEGLGGIGKTQIAIEAAFRVRDQYSDCSIFWVPAIDATSFENSYRDIGRKLKIKGIDEDYADVKTLVKDALRDSNGSWLLIVDNIDDANLLSEDLSLARYLPFSPKGSILFTTRNHKVIGPLGISKSNVIGVREMSHHEGLELLERHVQNDGSGDRYISARLLDFLAYHPLAIRQASAFMAENQISTTEYLKLCQSSEESAIDLLSEEFTDKHRYKTSQNPVATTWLISFEQISADDPLAAHYLKFMCFLAEKDIPRSLLPPAEEVRMIKSIATLKAHAFVIERNESNAYDIHRLIPLTMRNWLTRKGEMKECATTVIEHLANTFPPPTYKNRDMCSKYLPHALKVLEFGEILTNAPAREVLLNALARSQRLLGNHREVKNLYERALALAEAREADDDDPLRLEAMYRVARSFDGGLGGYKEAEKLHRQVLEVRMDKLGAEHLDTLQSMYGLSCALADQKNYKEAEKLLRQVHEVQADKLGAEHPSTLKSMSHLANMIKMQGGYPEAEKLTRQVLEIQTEKLGAEHPTTLKSMSHLANIFSMQGRFTEAESLHRQILELRMKLLGAEHPRTLSTSFELAKALDAQGYHEEAVQLYQKVLPLREKKLGAEHPQTLETSYKLAEALDAQGNHEEAVQLYLKVLPVQSKILGAEHHDTLRTMRGLECAIESQGGDQGEYKEAEDTTDSALHKNSVGRILRKVVNSYRHRRAR